MLVFLYKKLYSLGQFGWTWTRKGAFMLDEASSLGCIISYSLYTLYHLKCHFIRFFFYMYYTYAVYIHIFKKTAWGGLFKNSVFLYILCWWMLTLLNFNLPYVLYWVLWASVWDLWCHRNRWLEEQCGRWRHRLLYTVANVAYLPPFWKKWNGICKMKKKTVLR